MSQSWHAHWVEDGYRPTRLGNWEVPRWHAQWPDMHCTTTKFEAHKNGRLFASIKRSENPWSNFKGTWELPLKINRKTAEEISKATECKKSFWDAHKAKNQQICQRVGKAKGSNKNSRIESKNRHQSVETKNEIDKFDSDDKNGSQANEDTQSKKSSNINNKSEDQCKIKKTCLI